MGAPGQGALAVVCREDDDVARRAVGALDDAGSRATAAAERAFLNALRGGCRAPVAASATVVDGTLRLRGLVLAPDGTEALEGERSGPAAEPEAAGRLLADDVLALGAARLVAAART